MNESEVQHKEWKNTPLDDKLYVQSNVLHATTKKNTSDPFPKNWFAPFTDSSRDYMFRRISQIEYICQ